MRTVFETARRRAKLTGVTPHVLRHKFASRLVMQGVDLRTVMELGGWKNLGMVQRYSHLNQQHRLEAVELLAKNSHSLFPPVALEAEKDQTPNLRVVNNMGR